MGCELCASKLVRLSPKNFSLLPFGIPRVNAGLVQEYIRREILFGLTFFGLTGCRLNLARLVDLAFALRRFKSDELARGDVRVCMLRSRERGGGPCAAVDCDWGYVCNVSKMPLCPWKLPQQTPNHVDRYPVVSLSCTARDAVLMLYVHARDGE